LQLLGEGGERSQAVLNTKAKAENKSFTPVEVPKCGGEKHNLFRPRAEKEDLAQTRTASAGRTWKIQEKNVRLDRKTISTGEGGGVLEVFPIERQRQNEHE